MLARIDLLFLPMASPELQPAEHLWSLVDEPVANRSFADPNVVLVARCQVLRRERRMVKTATWFS